MASQSTQGDWSRMIVPARKLIGYVKDEERVEGWWGVRDPTGEITLTVDWEALDKLIDRGLVYGVVKGKRIKSISLIKTLDEADRAFLKSERLRLSERRAGEASKSWVKEWIPSTSSVVYAHHRGRCLAWTRLALPVVEARQ